MPTVDELCIKTGRTRGGIMTVLELLAKATTPKRPTRDEFELEELGNQLAEAKDDGDKRSLSVWGCRRKCVGGSRFLTRVLDSFTWK